MRSVVVGGMPGASPLGADELSPPTGLSPKPSREPAELVSPGGVLGVIVERPDGTCALYTRGGGGDWPSMRAAHDALGQVVPALEWRQSTPGVWVARAGDREPELPARTRSSRAAFSPRPGPRPPSAPKSDSYIAARIIRGVGTKS
jgi:hypothetical protein